MDDKASLILLTYRGKALLMYKFKNAVDTKQHDWTLIGCVNDAKQPSEKALTKIVRNETSIELESIEKLSEYFYHSRLTDDHVNNIKRNEGQLLDFFSLKDIQKLQLAQTTRTFISKHAELIEKNPS